MNESSTRDRQVRRTRRLLHKALMRLVLQKKYESITVQDILDRADVGRSTFYTHFRDKDDLLRDGLHYLNHAVNSGDVVRTKEAGRCDRIISFSLPMFEHAKEYRAVIRALLGSTAEIVVRQHIQSLLTSIVSQRVKTELRHHKPLQGALSSELLTDFIVSTYVWTFMLWLSSRNPLSPREIDAVYRAFVLPSMESIFR